MAVNDVFHQAEQGVADSGDFIIDPSNSATGAAEVHEIAGTGDADIYRESDPNDDNSYEVSVLIDQVTSQWHSQQNQLTISVSNNHRIRVNNTSGSSQDFFATGMEVND